MTWDYYDIKKEEKPKRNTYFSATNTITDSRSADSYLSTEGLLNKFNKIVSAMNSLLISAEESNRLSYDDRMEFESVVSMLEKKIKGGGF